MALIKNSIDRMKYILAEGVSSLRERLIKDEPVSIETHPKVFISHAKADKRYAIAVIELLEPIGIKGRAILSSSVPEYSVPLNSNRFDYLEEEFRANKFFMVYILSPDYYKDVPCMNELGASWVLKSKYTTIRLPGVTTEMQGGVLDGKRIGISFDADEDELISRLNEFKNVMVRWFGLEAVPDVKWERLRKEFIEKMTTPIFSAADCIPRIKEELCHPGKELTRNSIINLGYSRDMADKIIKQLIREHHIRQRYSRLIWK